MCARLPEHRPTLGRLPVALLLGALFFGSGSAWASPRFVNLGEGSVLDTRTRERWLANGTCLLGHAPVSGVVINLYAGMCALTDGSESGAWLVPSLQQLETLVAPPENYRAVSLNAAGFTGILNGGYWTLDDDPFDSSKRMVIHFQDGNRYSVPESSTMGTLAVGSQIFHFLEAPGGVDVGSAPVNGTSASRTIALSNLGGGYLEYSPVGSASRLSVSDISLVGGDSAMFVLDKGDGDIYDATGVGACGPTPRLYHATYPPSWVGSGVSAPCTVSVAFRPTSPGPKWTVLRITSAGKNPVRDILLSGNTLVSWWKADDAPTDSVGSNHGTLQVIATALESGTATASCPAGSTIASYVSSYGAQATWEPCGSCTVGSASCSVTYDNAHCKDPLPGVAKAGKLSLQCTGGYAVG